MESIQEKVKLFIRQNNLLDEHARVIVGLSGGPDSVCLALMLHRLGYEVIAVHCNFHLRDEESWRDEQFATALCEKNGIICHKAEFDTLKYAKEQKISIEMAARELRYSKFRHLKKELKADAIAVGHHKSDNAETIILNLIRGTGVKGLCGMQPRNEDIVRPLLCLTRQEILSFLQDLRQGYVVDHTNMENDYARNKVRLDILPTMEQINPGVIQNLTSTIENMNEVQKVYRKAIDDAIKECCERKANGELYISIQKLEEQPSPLSVLHEVLAPMGFNKAQLKNILAATKESGKIFTGKWRRLLIDRDFMIIESTSYPPVNIDKEIVSVESINMKKDNSHAYIDADKLHGELCLRTPLEGDSFAPFGMGGKRKLLSDFLTNQKLNLFEKERLPLLMDGDEIVWVAGLRSSELYRVDDKTQKVIILSLKS